jgi:hypothetical protein
MTLIVTSITDLGIINASDSNLTAANDAAAGVADKVFELTFCPGSVAFCGTYQAAEESMDSWMSTQIDTYANGADPTLRGFAFYLSERLEADGGPGFAALIHIAGYAIQPEGGCHPEMWFVRNVDSIDAVTGEYEGDRQDFLVTEEFWRNHQPSAGAEFFNGFPAGRITYNGLRALFEAFLGEVWANPQWDFRPPIDLAEQELLLRLRIDLVGTLFQVSDATPYVGGPTQTMLTVPPPDAVPL